MSLIEFVEIYLNASDKVKNEIEDTLNNLKTRSAIPAKDFQMYQTETEPFEDAPRP